MKCVLMLSVNEDKPIYVAEAAESTGRQWINNLPFPRHSANYSLTLVWQGRYSSDARYGDDRRNTAKPWTPDNTACTSSRSCVDDRYDNAK